MKSILIAEDEYDISLALELVFSAEGYRVVTAANGKEALDKMQVERPDLVILDVMMPVLTGLEALKLIRQTPAFSDIPVVLMSAASLRAKQEDYQWSAFIRKPFDVDEVLNVVERLLK